jgi:hypothetical protein
MVHSQTAIIVSGTVFTPDFAGVLVLPEAFLSPHAGRVVDLTLNGNSMCDIASNVTLGYPYRSVTVTGNYTKRSSMLAN